MPRDKKKSPTTFSLEGFRSRGGLSECLSFIAQALGRSGWDKDNLPPYQYRLLHDLQEPLDEQTLAAMLEFWEWDLGKLYQRGRDNWGSNRAPAKPRIDIWIEVTSKGNLKAEWFPRGGGVHHQPLDTDFPSFQRWENRGAAFGTRPSNELFFIHDFHIAHDLHFQNASYASATPTFSLNSPLLWACACVVGQLKDRLKAHFDVRMCTDVFVKWEQSGEYDWASWTLLPVTLEGWTIEDPVKRDMQAELAELEEMDSRLGFGEAAILEARAAVATRSRTEIGPAPSPHTLAERVTKEMKARGFPATLGKVRRALELVGRHRRPSTNVVQLRP